MIFHYFTDLVDICFRLVVFQLQIFQLIAAFFEKSKESFFLILFKVFEFGDNVGQHLTDFAHILGTHIIQCILGKISDFFLAACAVLHDHLGIGNINLGGKVVYHLLFFGRQCDLRYLRLFFL